MFTRERKIVSAERLMLEREKTKTSDGKSYSHKRLHDALRQKYEKQLNKINKNPIAEKTLQNYELTDTQNSRFNSAFAMSVTNLSMLADFYGVTCDYLLGYDKDEQKQTNQFASNLGLDSKSIEILKCLKKDLNKQDILFTLNSIIHSANTELLVNSFNSSKKNEPIETEHNKSRYLPNGFLDKLSNYLYYDGHGDVHEPQQVSDGDVLEFTLFKIMQMITKARRNFSRIRELKQKKIRYAISKKEN